MSDFLSVAGGVAGAVLLYYGAEYLVRGGSAVAAFCRVPKLFIGLTLIAFGTSAPELVVSIDAALKNAGDIAAGNVIGSNICNVALILGVSAVIFPLAVPKSLFKIDLPLLTFITFLFAGIEFFRSGVSRLDAALFLTIFALYLWVRIRFSPGELAAAAEEEKSGKKISLPKALFFTVSGLAGLVTGAKLFVHGAVVLARIAGVSEAVIALTVVALGTSLPELATSAVAAWKQEAEIAVGNVVGSNLFNLLVIMGIAPLVSPISTPGIVAADLGVMCFVVVALWGLMPYKNRIGRAGGVFLLAVYAGYLASLFFR